MPLTPAEVHNVAFKKPPIGKRGYDEEEVDAFLDIVEVELARLIEENNELRNRGGSGQPAAAQPAGDGAELKAAREENTRLQSRIAELERAASQDQAQAKSGGQQQAQQVSQLQQQLAQTEQQLEQNRKQLEQAQRNLEQAQQRAAGQPAAAAPPEHHAQAVQMLAMAQETADKHLSQSKTEAERLLSEAKSNAETTLAQANERSSRQIADAENRAKQLHEQSTTRANQTVQEAEQRAATITSQLEQRKAALERRLEELRTFEREYRARLKSYLESQLRDLDASGRAEPAKPAELSEAQQK